MTTTNPSRKRQPLELGRKTLATALILAMIAGCQEISKQKQRPNPMLSTAPGGEKISSRLSSSQTSDVEVAMGRSLESQGDPEGALAAYRAALKLDPKRVDAMARSAVIHDRRGQFELSGPLYDRALKASPNDPDLLCDRGYSLYLQGKYPESEALLRRAIAAKADHARAHNNLGLVLGRTGRSQDALGEFSRGGCNEVDSRLNLAFALTLDHHWELARSEYAHALAADPSSNRARAGLHELDLIAARQNRPSSPKDSSVLTAGALLEVPFQDVSADHLPPLPFR